MNAPTMERKNLLFTRNFYTRKCVCLYRAVNDISFVSRRGGVAPPAILYLFVRRLRSVYLCFLGMSRTSSPTEKGINHSVE